MRETMTLVQEAVISLDADRLCTNQADWLDAFGYLAEERGWTHSGPCTCQHPASGHAPRCGWIRER